MPLLGMPMAAVLYPGKILYATLPYPWAARTYVLAHVALAWAGMAALCRGWGQSATAAGLAAMAYAFGAPVLFQYSNVIFLVGAAWLPWGLLATERLLRQGRRSGLLGLAGVLALQVLGGDPEAAYLTALAGAGYALVLATWDGSRCPGGRWWWRRRWWCCGAAALAWVVVTLGLAYATPKVAATGWVPPGRVVRPLAWGLAGVLVLGAWRRRGRAARLGPMLAALAGATALAAALAAAQIAPTLEYTGNTLRAADERPIRIYGFCVEPYRAVELIWPNAYGKYGPANRSWVEAIPPTGERQLWTPSLYLGGLTLVLALGGLAAGDGPPWRAWLALVAVIAATASLGRFGGPLWLARGLPGAAAVLGPHDPLRGMDRVDEYLHDGAGSVYGLLAAVLPGFALFRYPAKLTTFAALAVAGLAGWGWDRLAAGEARGPRRWCIAGLTATLAAVPAVLGLLVAWLGRHPSPDIEFGPADPWGGLAESARGLVHGGIVFALGLILATRAPRHPRGAGALALLVTTLDLGLANAWLIWTAPQATFEATPRAARVIADAERDRPSPGPFRVNKMGLMCPPHSKYEFYRFCGLWS